MITDKRLNELSELVNGYSISAENRLIGEMATELMSTRQQMNDWKLIAQKYYSNGISIIDNDYQDLCKKYPEVN